MGPARISLSTALEDLMIETCAYAASSSRSAHYLPMLKILGLEQKLCKRHPSSIEMPSEEGDTVELRITLQELSEGLICLGTMQVIHEGWLRRIVAGIKCQDRAVYAQHISF